MCWQSKRFYWERAAGWRAVGNMACSLGFYGDGVSFRVVLSQSFWLRVLPGGARLVQPRWMPERILGSGQTVVSPFDLSQTLLVSGGLLVPRFLPGPPVVKQLMQMVTMVPDQGGQFQKGRTLISLLILWLFRNMWSLHFKCMQYFKASHTHWILSDIL